MNLGDAVSEMHMECYPEMATREFERLVAQAKRRFGVESALLVHRYGHLMPGDPIVVIAVATEHRGEAFDACRFLIEALKSSAPFWKREQTQASGSRWVASA
ncbi:molybdopterin converting factor, subunit 2 [gamma proteobacterium HTCC5015]|nr:molybdopterin converting factor, subunit 2 [gamma proteobacterium HTCC5015]